MTGFGKFGTLPGNVTSFQLDNGMTFVVAERHATPTISLITYVDVGSAQDPPRASGLAHLLEHVAFAGTPTIGTTDYTQERRLLEDVDESFWRLRAARASGSVSPTELLAIEHEFQSRQAVAGQYIRVGELYKILQEAGGRHINAFTTVDGTTYSVSLLSNALELWFYLESERFLQPVMRGFYSAQQVVLEEMRLHRCDSLNRVGEELRAVAFDRNPYCRPVAGYREDVENISRDEAEAFFRKHYVPAAVTISIVGDARTDHVRELAIRYFGRIGGRPRSSAFDPCARPVPGEKRVQLEGNGQSAVLTAFYRPPISDPENLIYETITSLLTGGPSSRLNRALVRHGRIAVHVGGAAAAPGQKYHTQIVFWSLVAPGHRPSEVETVINRQLERLKTELIGAAELECVKRRMSTRLIRSFVDNDVLAKKLSVTQALTGDWRNVFRQLERVNAVTAEELRRVSQAAFVPSNRTVGISNHVGES